MAKADYPVYNYPTGSVTDPVHLAAAMGSFWNIVFQEQGTLKGYTTAQAEEVVQHYMDLLDIIDSFSVKDIPLFKRQKWYPIVLRRSQYNRLPLKFYNPPADEDKNTDPNWTVFGPQPPEDIYHDLIFKFGHPKEASSISAVYTHPVEDAFKDFSVISNGLVEPSVVWTKNIDVILKNGILYFYPDVFNDDRIAKAYLINDDGTYVYFTDEHGQQVKDEILILWAYQGAVDEKNLFYKFGYIFDLFTESTDFYRNIVKWLINLYTSGTTVYALKAIIASFTGNSIIKNAYEYVEEVFHDTKVKVWVVVTDSNIYRFSDYYSPLPTIVPGAKLMAGSVLNDAVDYYDLVTARDWWRVAFKNKDGTVMDPVAISSYLFLGNYQYNLAFANSYQYVIMDATTGDLTFPVYGSAADVKLFHDNINLRQVPDETGHMVYAKELVARQLGLTLGGDGVPAKLQANVNVTDFLFNNFFKYNVAFLRLNFEKPEQSQLFTSLLKDLHMVLPEHVYLMFYFDCILPVDPAILFNESSGIPEYEIKDGFKFAWKEGNNITYYEMVAVKVGLHYEIQVNEIQSGLDLYGFRMIADDGTIHTVDYHFDYSSSAFRFYIDASGIWIPNPGYWDPPPDGDPSIATGTPYESIFLRCAADGAVTRVGLYKSLTDPRGYFIYISAEARATSGADGTNSSGQFTIAPDNSIFDPTSASPGIPPLYISDFDMPRNQFAMTKNIGLAHGVPDLSQEISCSGLVETADQRVVIRAGGVSSWIPTNPVPTTKDIRSLSLFSFYESEVPTITLSIARVEIRGDYQEVMFDYTIPEAIFNQPPFLVTSLLELQYFEANSWHTICNYETYFERVGELVCETPITNLRLRIKYRGPNTSTYFSDEVTTGLIITPAPREDQWEIRLGVMSDVTVVLTDDTGSTPGICRYKKNGSDWILTDCPSEWNSIINIDTAVPGDSYEIQTIWTDQNCNLVSPWSTSKTLTVANGFPSAPVMTVGEPYQGDVTPGKAVYVYWTPYTTGQPGCIMEIWTALDGVDPYLLAATSDVSGTSATLDPLLTDSNSIRIKIRCNCQGSYSDWSNEIMLDVQV